MDNKKVASSFIWRFLERSGAQGVTFIVSLVLARLLDPAVYGTVALVTVFTTIMQVFVDSGMGNALIQKKEADDLDFSSVFYFNMVSCTLMYLILFFGAPLIAKFYKMQELVPVIRVLGLILIISGVKNIQQAYVSRHLMFRKFFFATLGGTVGAAVVGIVMAWRGLGVWALVAQYLFNAAVDTIILWVTVKWRPKKMFSFDRLRGLFSFGWKLLVSSLIDTVYRELRPLIIGKVYTTSDLAFFNKGENFPKLIVTNINSSIDSVLLPTMSNEQDNVTRVRGMTRRAIKTSTYIMMPMMIGLAVCAEPLIRIILTEKWLPCVFFMRVFCFTYAFYPIHTANLNAIKAVGRSDIYLRLEVIKKIIGLAATVGTMFISVKAMALGMIAISIISQVLNSTPNKKLLGYSYFDQLRDILPGLTLSAIMGAAVFCVTLFHLEDWITLFIQVPLGALIYIAGSKVFKLDSFDYIWQVSKSFIPKRRQAAGTDEDRTNS